MSGRTPLSTKNIEDFESEQHGWRNIPITLSGAGLTTMQRESRYAGMTTNERLFDAGLLSEWTAAARSRSRERMIELLGKVDLGDQAESIADTVLSNPGKYGF
jgi:hypothetical protein